MTAAATGAGADSADAGSAERVALLVAALELLGALASTAERVTVEVGDTLVLTGAGWVDPYRELAAAHETAAAAGVALGTVETGDELVRLVVHHRPSVTASTARVDGPRVGPGTGASVVDVAPVGRVEPCGQPPAPVPTDEHHEGQLVEGVGPPWLLVVPVAPR